MNGRDAALERLLDTGLEERFGGRRAPDVRDAVEARLAGATEAMDPAPNRRGFVTAALVLLGVVVAAGVGWLRTGAHDPTAQEPRIEAPNPSPCLVRMKPGDLAAVPVETRSLLFSWLAADEDFAVLQPYKKLQKLMIFGNELTRTWPADLLAPIAAMPELCVLLVPLQPGMTHQHLRQLAAAPALQFLSLHLHRPLSADDVDALCELPHLRSLHLVAGRLDAALVRSLARLPHLEELTFNRIGGCSEAVLRELRTMHSLRCVRFVELGERPIAARLGSNPWRDGVGLTEGVARALAELPLLDEVSIENCAVTAAAIRCLPARLRAFSLTRCLEADVGVVAALQHFDKLGTLGLDRFDRQDWRGAPQVAAAPKVGPAVPDPTLDGLPEQEAIWRAQAELVQRLPLERLRYTGGMPAEVTAALPRAAKLQDVVLEKGRQDDVVAVARVSALRRLQLVSFHGIEVADLAPLAGVASLQRLELRWTSIEKQAAAAALPGVDVRVD